MKGFKKVLRFKIFDNYSNARKIADDIILSLMKNDIDKDIYSNCSLPIYVPTVRTSFLSTLVNFFHSNNEDIYFRRLMKECAEREDYKIHIITIYEVVRKHRKRIIPPTFTNEDIRNILLP